MLELIGPETLLVVIALMLGLLCPGLGARAFRKLEDTFEWILTVNDKAPTLLPYSAEAIATGSSALAAQRPDPNQASAMRGK